MSRTKNELLLEWKARLENERGGIIGVIVKLDISDKTRSNLQAKLDDKNQLIKEITNATMSDNEKEPNGNVDFNGFHRQQADR